MNSKDLRPWQLAKMWDSLGPMQRYLNRLVERVEKGGFPGNDPLYLEAREAQAAVQKLSMSMHYLRCASGTVGEPQQRPASDSI